MEAPTTRPCWAADPSGRNQLRYWSGTSWTRQVFDGRAVGVDWQLYDLDALPPPATGADDAGGGERERFLPLGWHLALIVATSGLWLLVLPAVYFAQRRRPFTALACAIAVAALVVTFGTDGSRQGSAAAGTPPAAGSAATAGAPPTGGLPAPSDLPAPTPAIVAPPDGATPLPPGYPTIPSQQVGPSPLPSSAPGPSPSATGLPTVPGAVVPATRYARCADLQRVYPHGVGMPGAIDRTPARPDTAFEADLALYQANAHLDRDGDGIACEDGASS